MVKKTVENLTKENVWHTIEASETFKQLETNEKGLSTAKAEERLKKYGFNEIESEKKASKLALLLEKIKNPIVLVLIFAAIISLFVEHYYDALVIFIVIIIDMIVGFIQEFKAEEAINALKSMSAPEAEVIRDGSEMRIKAKDIVPGDILLLDAGDKIPADSRILESFNLEINESMLTGESIAVRKTSGSLPSEMPVEDRKNIAFSGTIITQGRGKAVVIATGMSSEIGKIARLMKETEKAETPIQKRTLDLGKKIGYLALVTSIVTFAVAILQGIDLLDTFLFVIAAAVSAIPQGLPIVVTVTLAVGLRRMAKRNAIIRKLQAVDTLGSATVICTDKTGTLTTNQMTIQKIMYDNRLIEVSGAGYAPKGQFSENGVKIDPEKDEGLLKLLQTAVLCNDARLRQHEVDKEIRWDIHGDPTEGALVVAGEKGKLHKGKLEEEFPRVDEIPFDPKERYMATFHETKAGQIDVHVKGAPESVLEVCSYILEGGKIEPLSEQKKEAILEFNTEMASQALRVLAMAYQTVEAEERLVFKKEVENKSPSLIFLGLMGMIDPPRPEAKRSVKLCKKAGIKIIMATGDQKLTAQAIAKEVGILEKGSIIISGAELEKMSDEQLDGIIEKTSVFARASPTHKYRIVESLRRKGHIVAMTGDGVNDAPALKAAEIGVAMGITGTDVTKETADMILTDDNFASIVNAVEEGRVVFENIRKVVKYLIATNAGEIIAFLGALFLFPGQFIFTAVQILWVNLVTDGLLDKFIAMEPKETGVMDKPPRKPDAKIINRSIMFNTIFVGLFMGAGTLWVYSYALDRGDLLVATTMAFCTISLFQVFSAANCRSRTQSVFQVGLFKNKYLIIAMFVSVLLQVLATVLPPLQVALGTTVLSIWDWIIIFGVASSVFIAEEIRKYVGQKMKVRKAPD
jgi:P-type Ca2+ transporter type 2C